MSEREEVLLESGFVLHHRPYRNTSMIVECLTAAFGRQVLVAQGARRAETRQRSLLQPFRRLRLSWVRRGEMGRLTGIEADGPALELSGECLLSGFYLNELLLRLVQRGDQNDAILNCYSGCLDGLAASREAARALRLFELGLLEALGFGIDLERDCRTGEAIEPDRLYVFEHEGGLTASEAKVTMEQYSGRHLISLREHALDDNESLRAAKLLLGGILHNHLGERPLRTRAVMREIVALGLAPR
jgi:DNA repair protein RecO (recombination protein O)